MKILVEDPLPRMPAQLKPIFDDLTLSPGCGILLLEDDIPFRKRLGAYLRQLGAQVSEASSLEEARRLLRDLKFEFALADMHLPDGDVLALFREGAFSENTGIVVMTAFGGVKQAVEAMRLGAGDYLSKPFEAEELPLAFIRCRKQRLAARRAEHRAKETAADADQIFFGESLRSVRQQIDTIVATERRLERQLPPVLIEGETGTGKSVLARWLHRQGPRSGEPFINLNCAALPETLADAELFGHERGAFTDAKGARVGLFEAADGGTLFLDEVSSLTLSTQAKVLTAVEEGTIRRLGGSREITVDVRLITASNRPLEDLVRQGAFREDLYHRMNLLRITLPPLRERGTDILPLARHLLARIAARHRLKGPTITPEGEARLLAQPWRGNVRELSHEIERAVIFGGDAPLDFATLGGTAVPRAGGWRNPAWRMPEEGFSLDATVDELIAEAMRETQNNVSAAARRLGVTRDFVRYRLPDAKTET
jgi:DNA-binding NtrC family response regulator